MSENTFNTDLLELLFNNVAMPDVGDSAGLQPSSAAGNLYVALHTDDPTAAGLQDDYEATYTGYDRVAVARSASGWTVDGNNVSNTEQISFPEATGGNETITHVTIGLESSGASKVMRVITLENAIAVSTGVKPKFEIGELDVDITM